MGSYQFPPLPGLQIGGRFFSQAELQKLMSEGVSGGILSATTITNGNGSGFCLSDGTFYQAPSDMYVQAVVAGIQSTTALAAYKYFIGYSDTAVPYNTSSPGTNPVYYGTGTGTNNFAAGILNESPTPTILSWTIPAGKYPFFLSLVDTCWAQMYFFL